MWSFSSMKIRFTSQHHKSQGRNIGPDALGLGTGGSEELVETTTSTKQWSFHPGYFVRIGTTLIYMGIIFINQYHNFGGSCYSPRWVLLPLLMPFRQESDRTSLPLSSGSYAMGDPKWSLLILYELLHLLMNIDDCWMYSLPVWDLLWFVLISGWSFIVKNRMSKVDSWCLLW